MNEIVRLERHVASSDESDELVLSTPIGIKRRLLQVLVKYSAAPTQAGASIVLDSGAGAEYDTILKTGSANAQHSVFIPENDVYLMEDDAVKVTAPSGGPAATAASGTVTSTANGNPSDGDTITVGEETYTFKTALSSGPTVPFEVKIGADGEETLNNLRAALSAGAGEGTAYSEGTTANALANAPDAAAADGADFVLTIVAIAAGTSGNSIVLTEDASNLTVSGTGTLEGGTDAITSHISIYTSLAE